MPALPDARAVSISTAGYEDGLGRRSVRFDREVGGMLECLRLRPELRAFEVSLRERADAIGRLDDERFVPVRAIECGPSGLTVVSELVPGERLIDVIEARQKEAAPVFGIDAALGLLLQALPALSTLHGASLSHGLVSPGRLLVTSASQIVLLDAIYAAAVERLSLSRSALWSSLGILATPVAGINRLDRQTDVLQACLCALVLATGKPVARGEVSAVAPLVEEAAEVAEIRAGAEFAVRVRQFFTATLPVTGRRPVISTDDAIFETRALADLIGEEGCHAALAELTRIETPARPSLQPAPEPRLVVVHPPKVEAVDPPGRDEPVDDEAVIAEVDLPEPVPAPAPVAAARPTAAPVATPVAAAAETVSAAPQPTVEPAPPAPLIPASRVVVPIEMASPAFAPAQEPVRPAPPMPVFDPPATAAPPVSFTPTPPIPPTPVVAPAAPPVQFAPPPAPFAPPAPVTPPPVPSPPITIAAAPAPIAIAATPPPIAIAVAPPAALKVRSEPPPGYAPARSEAETTARALPFLERAREEEPGRFPWKVIAAAIVLVTIGIMAARTYLPGADPATTIDDAPPVAAAGLAPAAGAAAAAPPAKTGGLAIDTQPTGAKVSIDGRDVGVTPVTVDSLEPGRHSVVVSTPTANVRRTVRVEAGRVVNLEIPIYPGWVTVFSPIALDIAAEGRTIGSTETGKIMLPPGRHELTLSNREFGYSDTRTVEIHPGEERPLNVEPKGTVSVNAHPWAEVWVDGRKAGDTPVANLKVLLGTRVFLFKHPQFGERRITMTITSTPAVLSVDLTRPE